MELTPEQLAEILAALGLELPATDPIDPAEIVALIVAKAGELTAAVDTGESGDSVAAAQMPGMVALHLSTVQELRADAERGRTLVAAAVQRDQKVLIESAVRRGAIHQREAASWVAMAGRDFDGTRRVLATIPDSAAVPMTEIGTGQASGDTSDKPGTWF
ncbi:hypothetical protein [Williamsia sp. 1135]|uniref:hypothetical protein n=1 Tax=Williamsia sp. 1135 TaxID=1889262 RepID=UPI000A1030E1|nr:hypothetical protein [Williamsia sp. 1135]ORM38179.1 hypothetical protein BFL43_00935 [Williamsia sp. 1135]